MSHPDATTHLLRAIHANDLTVVDTHLDAGADVHAERDGNTPLTWAAELGHVRVAERLLDRGARASACTSSGWDALVVASAYGWMEMGELLLGRGVDVHKALQVALMNGRYEMATWLLDHGALLDASSSTGRSTLFSALHSDYADLGRLLEQPGVREQLDAKRGDRARTALHDAAKQGVVEPLRQLLGAGASCGVTDQCGMTPLHLACQSPRVEVLRELLQHGADVNAMDAQEETPLMLLLSSPAAYTFEGVQMVKLLLEHHADVSTIQNQYDETARDVAVRNGLDELVEVLDLHLIKLQLVSLLLGLRGPNQSPLTRFASHSTFEPKILSLVKCLLAGEEDAALDQLQHEASSSSTTTSSPSKKSRLS